MSDWDASRVQADRCGRRGLVRLSTAHPWLWWLGIAIVVLTAGCGPDDEPAPAPTRTTSPPIPRPSVSPTLSLPTIAIGQWLPEPATCAADEVEVAQPPELQSLLRVCRESDMSALTMVNTSGTTLGFDTVGWPRKSRFAVDETELARSLLAQRGLLVNEADNALWLPASFSTRIEDAGRITTFRVFTDFRHGQRVAQTRALGRLVSQVPYAQQATEPAPSALAEGIGLCLGADGETPLEKLIEEAAPCKELFEHLVENWDEEHQAEVRAGRTPAHAPSVPSDDLRLTISGESRQVDEFLAPLSKLKIRVAGRSIRMG